MHILEKKIIELGAIDSEITKIHIDEWFENVVIVFEGSNNHSVICIFNNCFEILLKHDKAYSKGEKRGGKLNYKYYIQDIRIEEKEDFYCFKILAWPLDGEIICKKIRVEEGD